MTLPVDLAALPPAQRSHVLLAEARATLDRQLWQAALGQADELSPGRPAAAATACGCDGDGDDGLWRLLRGLAAPAESVSRRAEPRQAEPGLPAPVAPAGGLSAAPGASAVSTAPLTATGLGANAVHAPALARAAARSGLSVATLAAIVDAEAGKRADGSWNAHARNPRSSAAGLGQFLSGTWIGLAETRGSALNALAAARGWLTDSGRVAGAARAPLLALRYDPATAIDAIADYSAANLRQLRGAGVKIGDSVTQVSRMAYLAHYLGPGDAVRFLADRIGEGRARTLLTAQIGAERAERRIAATGSAIGAHRQWLESHVSRNVRPDRYAA